MIELSISDNLTYGFKKYNIPFLSIGDYIKKYCYSASTYHNGHRHKDNIESLGNVLIYDFDDGKIIRNIMCSLKKIIKKYQQKKPGLIYPVRLIKKMKLAQIQK